MLRCFKMRVAVLCVVLSFVALGYSQSPAPCSKLVQSAAVQKRCVELRDRVWGRGAYIGQKRTVIICKRTSQGLTDEEKMTWNLAKTYVITRRKLESGRLR